MIHTVAETGSTNADLVARLRAGEYLPEGDWLVAERQTAGRGRQGRSWFDGYGNFMGSTAIHLAACDPVAHTLALVASLALYEAVLPLLPDPSTLTLKWPNDLMLGGAKLSGILLEREGQTVVLGIGVNLAAAPNLPDRRTASLADIAPAPDRELFGTILAGHFSRELARWRQFGVEPIRSRWLAAAHPIGAPIAVHDGSGDQLTGEFAGLSPEGSLLLRLEDGTTRAIHAGDVMLAEEA
ncbi:biotin--[acetyl-CoA-carboxylase] ligase [Parerythrobacter lacustris]|uniref:biotin--[biotin carboxyl-carrier protein] ligase n=1 Tax=Parerythrobacter lacustris TaxID=2969984 RepID=A0ABT1XQ01_9SPHN|nr:biotin--[acetyl-CoA-carboxylase] ligase [Parerythrobacter lacustris]MCR2833743.1 biotin--[acetyl-CoA-carboxylase] ligase [Parerythrobacter lacustris]